MRIDVFRWAEYSQYEERCITKSYWLTRCSADGRYKLSVTKNWNTLPREVVESPFLQTFKTHLETSCLTCSRFSALPGGRTG